MLEKFGISSDHPLLMYLGLNFCWKVDSISLSSSSYLIYVIQKILKEWRFKGFRNCYAYQQYPSKVIGCWTRT